MLRRFLDAILNDLPDSSGSAEPESAQPPAPIPFHITFTDAAAHAQAAAAQVPAPQSGNSAVAVRTPNSADPTLVTDGLRLPTPRPSLAIMGGAGHMTDEAQGQVRDIVYNGLGRFAADRALNVVDGGTVAGVMALMGAARSALGASFPLIGVAPNALVRYPGFDNPDAQAELEANHSHFALTTGGAWGDESNLLAGLAYAAAGGDAPDRVRTLGVVINGGEVVKREAYARACGVLRFPLLVLEGSGRFADELAAAHRAKGSADPLIDDIVQRGDVSIVPLWRGPRYLAGWLNEFFEAR